jgi:GxxExxY protein
MDSDHPARTSSRPRLLHAELTDSLIGIFYRTYDELGGGFAESVYANSYAIALQEAAIAFEREAPIEIRFHGQVVGVSRPDFIVATTVIVECKAVKALEEWHLGQVLHYLRATKCRVALLLNFGPKASIKRIVL